MNKKSQVKRNYPIDTLRTIATILVLLIHITAYDLSFAIENKVYDLNFWIANTINSLCRISIPIFVLISGRFLIGFKEPITVFYKKRLLKVLIPLIFWSLFYAFYKFLGQYILYGNWQVKAVLESFAIGKPFYHLWYLYMLFGLYLFAPVINYLVLNLSKKNIWVVSISFIVFGFLLNLYDFIYDNKPFFLLWFVNYIGYFMLGYVMKDIKKKIPAIFLILLAVISGILIAGVSYYTHTEFNNFYFYSYLSPFVIIASLSLYKIFTQIKIKKNFFSNFAHLTFGIYLIHPLLLDLITRGYHYNNLAILDYTIVKIIVKLTLVFFIPAILAKGFLKIKGFRKII